MSERVFFEIYTRRPATTGIFCAFSIWQRCNFKRLKRFFLKKHFFFINFSNFSNFRSFLPFLPKNFIMKAEKTFLRNKIFWYAFYNKFATFIDSEKINFFYEKPIFFFWKKAKFLTFWEILFFQSHSTEILVQFDENKIWHSDTWTFRHVNNRSIGWDKCTYLRGRICFPCFQYGAK